MKASELRIDNQLKYNKETVKIESILSSANKVFAHTIDEEVLYEIPINDLSPVPLTEAKLLELSFEKLKACDDMIIYRNREVDIEVNNLGIYFLATKVESVHHLQNIYHSLTGEELTPITK